MGYSFELERIFGWQKAKKGLANWIICLLWMVGKARNEIVFKDEVLSMKKCFSSLIGD